MRIGLDARTLYSPQRRGIGKSMVHLYHALTAANPDWEVYAYHRSPGFSPDDLPSSFVSRHIDIPGDRFDAWTQLRLPAQARLDKVDVLHCPGNFCPSRMPVPTVVTLMDLIPLDMPQTQDEKVLQRFEQAVVSACTKATAVVTPSRYTRRRLVQDHGLNPKRGIVVPLGLTIDTQALDLASLDGLLDRYQIQGSNYLLHFGAPDPRKNTRGVIEAWAMVRPAYRRGWKLLIVGLDDQTKASLNQMVQMLGLQDHVRLAGYASESELPMLLSGAAGLLYPSLSEGFGLPILEAFAVATPVITSDVTSLPEVAGDAAELVPPGVPTALSSAMTRLIKDPMRRGELVMRGSSRLMKFRWADAAEQYAKVFTIAARSRKRHKRSDAKRAAA